ncbi:mechanosensitive ion channel family protein [Noviherbaspirillum galbum]|uniref:Mechanosensitive ion channel n=1 Tax=Noviherbaspirillum galbum TaxID=2709383 RepID=A0A6B3SMI8_9BURK|nr:mechanosensitive ion channel domain-containing protein [Noviherbaspirillum galbum]NEX61943.1 mechanosensitive ion channel [Noviherbaspirillum galbum]
MWPLIVLILFGFQTTGFPQTPPKPSLPAANAPSAPAPPATAAPQPVPVSDIAVKAEAALIAIRQLENRGRVDDAIQTASEDLPPLEREIALRIREVRRQRLSTYSLESIRSVEDELRDAELRISPLRKELTRAAVQVDRDLKELDGQKAVWDATAKAAADEAAPQDVLERVRDLLKSIDRAGKSVLDDRAKVLALLGKVTDLGTQIGDLRRILQDASERAATRLLYRDSAPMWSQAFWIDPLRDFSAEARENILNQANNLESYVRSHDRDVALHAATLASLYLLFLVVRGRIGKLAEDDDDLKGNKALFDMPAVAAVLLAMLLSSWFYPRAPRSLTLMIGVIAAAPMLVFARRVVERRIYQVLFAVVGFFLVDRLRALFAPLPGVHRLILLCEALAMLVFVAVIHRRVRRVRAGIGGIGVTDDETPAEPTPNALAWRMVGYGRWIAGGLAVTALACDVAGYARLADLVMRALIGSAYLAVVLYVIARAGEGMLHGMLYLPPLSFLAGVRRHRAQIAARTNRWVQWAALAFWLGLTLEGAGLRQRLVAALQSFWSTTYRLGSLSATVSDVGMFVLILWTTWMLSRLSRFFLEEEIFSRVRLDRGLPYAVSTTVHYVILLSGLVLALTAIGVDMTKFTIVAGALTVGIGFGLQNIVNNFVSGLIVLFERPVKVGDTIQIDDIVGRVQHIGIRATVIHSTSGAGVIIPNGKLISDKLTNWTLSSQLRQIAVPVFTRPDINVARLKTTLLDVSRWNKEVLETPPPEVLFIRRGVDAFEFELRIWTGELDAWLKVRSDLITEINEALGNQELAAQASPASTPAPAS